MSTLRRLIDLPGVNALEYKALMKPRLADPEALGAASVSSNRASWTSRAWATRAAAWAVPSAGGGRARSAAVTGGTSTCRSIRSISGPEMRP